MTQTRAQGFIEGLNLFFKYDPSFDFCAEHDVIYAGPGLKADQISQQDKSKLEECGWNWSEGEETWVYYT